MTNSTDNQDMVERVAETVSEIKFVGDLHRLDVHPGDKFVLTVERPLSRGMHDQIQSVWRRFMGPDEPPLLVLEDGMTLGTFGPALNTSKQE